MVEQSNTEDFGANSWLVEEMYERYRDEPQSLSAAWREFFSDYKPVGTPKADPTGELVRPSFDAVNDLDDFVVESVPAPVAPVAASKLTKAASGKTPTVKEPISPETQPRAPRPAR